LMKLRLQSKRSFPSMFVPKLTQRLDVMLSHDWPRGIAHYGDLRRLLRAKPFLQGEVRVVLNTTKNSSPGSRVNRSLRPFARPRLSRACLDRHLLRSS
jgi:lariat debranching enzyme